MKSRINFFQIAASLFLAPLAQAQPNSPHIGYIYPAGGRIGTTFQVVVGGQFLNNASNVVVSGNGIAAQFVEFNRPMNQKEFNDLRDKWRELAEKRREVYQNKKTTNVWTSADEKSLAGIRARLLKNPPNRTAAPALADNLTLKISIATNAAPGDCEIRLLGPNGLSNPLKFCVGQLQEFSEPPVRAPNPDLDRFLERLGAPARTNSARGTMHINLPSVVNGQIAPGGVDRFRFSAQRGQRIVIAVAARELIPYLADAVPGWFQAAIKISDAKGRELAYDDHFRFHPDPVLCCEIPRDGEYFLQIRDSIYRGREDFVYRISIGELPFVTGIFPLGGKIGEETKITLSGWNLSVTNLTVTNESAGVREIPIETGEKFFNTVTFAADALPEISEREANDKLATAQRVTLPIVVNGRIQKSGDVDVFSFDGKSGEEIVADVLARRLNSPLDSTLELTDAHGKRIAFNDDFEDKSFGLETHHADSHLRAALPADGIYFLILRDAQRQGGAEFGYRLCLTKLRSDFALRVTPSSVSARGGTASMTVYALRSDGFTNAISLRLKDPPAGVFLSGATVPANQDEVRFTLTVPVTRRNESLALKLEGFAVIDGHEIVHDAIPAEDMMQAFAYWHLVASKELRVMSAGFAPQRPVRFAVDGPIQIPLGGTTRVRLGGAGNFFGERFQFELNEPPEGISLRKISSPNGTELELAADSTKAKSGLEGNLIINIVATPANAPRKNAALANVRRTPVSTLPALPFKIVAARSAVE
jgi:hypothetical protein